MRRNRGRQIGDKPGETGIYGDIGILADRVIRDELLTSGRYWSVSIEAQRLFVHLLLNADDTARFSGANFTVRSACFPGQSAEPEKVEKLLTELADVDLIRLYTADSLRFIFIPRFKQRLRFTKSKYPAPPNGISDLRVKKSDSGHHRDRQKSDSRPQKRREVKRSESTPPSPPSQGGLSASQEKPKTNGAWWEDEKATVQRGLEVGVTARPGEEWFAFRQRIRAAINAKEKG